MRKRQRDLHTYVKRARGDTWHFVRWCTKYPKVVAKRVKGAKPRSGELCNECRAKARG